LNRAKSSFTYVDLEKRERDVTSANLIVVLLVGAVVGALVGLGLGSVIHNPLYLGITAGFLATIAAGLVRNFLVSKGALGPGNSALPGW
jgi:putative flippase GtrA